MALRIVFSRRCALYHLADYDRALNLLRILYAIESAQDNIKLSYIDTIFSSVCDTFLKTETFTFMSFHSHPIVKYSVIANL